MTKTNFMDKYPVYSLEISKSETNFTNVRQIIEHLHKTIESHPVAQYIATFDHYTHTAGMNGEIAESIKDAQNIIFCFGKAIPNTQILAVRPRSIGVCELENSFALEFLEAPKPDINKAMEGWALSIANK